MEVGAERFPGDEGFELGKEVVELVDFVELVFDVEERRRTLVHKDGLKKRNLQRIPHVGYRLCSSFVTAQKTKGNYIFGGIDLIPPLTSLPLLCQQDIVQNACFQAF